MKCERMSSSTNQCPPEVPEWLDKEFIQNCLQDDLADKDLEVTSITTSQVVPPGNNYGSTLLRVMADFKDKKSAKESCYSVSLIVKAPSAAEFVKEKYEKCKQPEQVFYQKFLPIASNIVKGHNFVPKNYTSPHPDVLVLEDLSHQGFEMADRCKQLDFEHCSLYVAEAANLHAVSVAVHKMSPELVQNLGMEKYYTSGETQFLKTWALGGINYLADKMEEFSEYKKYSQIVRKCTSNIWEILTEAHKPKYLLNALHQGDPWITNMMFKYDGSGKVVELRLLDFQMLRYASPVNDLVFFIWTSANSDVRENRLEDLYHIYCDELNARLKEYNCNERLSYDQFLENIEILKPNVLLILASMHPIMTSKTPANLFDLFPLLKQDYKKAYKLFYNSEYCQNRLPRVLKQLESNGIFDYLDKHVNVHN